MFEVKFTATENLEINIQEQTVPIEHYLCHPQRLVESIADPNLIETLGDGKYRLKMRPLNFLEIYHFQPSVVLKVWSREKGVVNLESQECEMIGINYINERFFLNLQGSLFSAKVGENTTIKGLADLEVKIDLPPALWLTPKYLLQMAGNRLLKSVLSRMKHRLSNQLLQDYQIWAEDCSNWRKRKTMLN